MNQTIRIEKIIQGGQGLGRLNNGIVVLCPHVLPGEKIVVKEVKQHRGYINAELVDIIEPSENRITPACPFFSLCGGCDFQHIQYQSQLNIKKEIIRESLERSKTTMDLSALHTVLPSPKSYQYRFRIRLKLSPDGNLGFYETRSNRLVKIEKCLVATKRINIALQELKTSKIVTKLAPYFSEIELLQSPADDIVHAVFRSADINIPPVLDQLIKLDCSIQHVDHFSVLKDHTCMPVSKSSGPLLLKQDFSDKICGRPYSLTWSPDCFYQVNAEQNSMLVKHVLDSIGLGEGKRMLDLYCGMGNFSIPIAMHGADMLTGIELNKKSLAWARNNAIKNNLKNSSFFQGDVIHQLNRLIRNKARYDLIVLDPPRQGFGRKVKLLAKLKPDRILYISCDPATLMRDLAVLTDNGFAITTLTPVDMFPQTHHIESVALLEKN